MSKVKNLIIAAGLKQDLAKRRPKLYRIAYSWCHSTALADDLVQETLFKALKKIETLKEHATLDTWLYRIMLNCWHDYLRVKGRNVEYTERDDETQQTHVDGYQQGQIVDRVRASIATLPMSLREIVVLADFAGFSYADIAKISEIPIGTVMSRLYRARMKLKEQLLDLSTDEALPVKLTRVK